jgi:excisionase family DNA binding protein
MTELSDRKLPSILPAPRSNLPRLWSLERAAFQLDVPISFVRGLVRKGELEAVPLGHRTLRIREASLKAYLRRVINEES